MPNIYHYRTNDKKEIDFILQKADKLVAIEVKFAQTVTTKDFKHIIDFQKKSQEDVVGIVLYGGEYTLPFGDKRYAVPMGLFF
jgi:predicted AAA+ superfamily ATPase